MKTRSIAAVLNDRKDEIFALCQGKHQFIALKAKVNEILESEELSGNKSVNEAKIRINKYQNKYDSYLTTLVTYMTCITVSTYNKDGNYETLDNQ